uniref:Uncharacterized protein n=1 Tax=Anopheles culicifacies TaxID=139723 RepID=A0A182MQF6_9DIPT
MTNCLDDRKERNFGCTVYASSAPVECGSVVDEIADLKRQERGSNPIRDSVPPYAGVTILLRVNFSHGSQIWRPRPLEAIIEEEDKNITGPRHTSTPAHTEATSTSDEYN